MARLTLIGGRVLDLTISPEDCTLAHPTISDKSELSSDFTFFNRNPIKPCATLIAPQRPPKGRGWIAINELESVAEL